MAWQIKFNDDAKKELSKLDKQVAKRITKFLHNRLAPLDDPRSIGEALQGATFGEFWKYRIGDYRVIASIKDRDIYILVLKIGNRREVYR